MALTFLPDENYLLAEIFFLPVVRMAVWPLGAGVVHLGIRLAGKPSNMDQILQTIPQLEAFVELRDPP